MTVARAIATSPDGQWVVTRADRRLVLIAGSGGTVATAQLEADDTDLAIVHGPPNVVIAVTRAAGTTRITLLFPPELEPTAKIDLPGTHSLVAITGGRFAMLSADHRELTIIRATGRGLSSHPIDVQGNVLEFVAGIERNQLVVSQPKKLEVWDAVSGRPLRKLVLELPPGPRTITPTAGHLIATRPASDELFVYRLSDGRPFRHFIGAPVEQVLGHPTSPLAVLVTTKGLVRLHCYAHSLFTIEAPAGHAIAQLAAGDDVSLLGFDRDPEDLWRIPLGGTIGTPLVVEEPAPASPAAPAITAADKLRAMREALPVAQPAAVSTPASPSISAPRRPSTWRDALATFGDHVLRNIESELPAVAADTELAELAQRHELQGTARRGLAILYALYLVGEPALSLARFARLLGDWPEALGQGQLGTLGLIEKAGGKVRLAAVVSDALDGVTAAS